MSDAFPGASAEGPKTKTTVIAMPCRTGPPKPLPVGPFSLGALSGFLYRPPLFVGSPVALARLWKKGERLTHRAVIIGAVVGGLLVLSGCAVSPSVLRASRAIDAVIPTPEPSRPAPAPLLTQGPVRPVAAAPAKVAAAPARTAARPARSSKPAPVVAAAASAAVSAPAPVAAASAAPAPVTSPVALAVRSAAETVAIPTVPPKKLQDEGDSDSDDIEPDEGDSDDDAEGGADEEDGAPVDPKAPFAPRYTQQWSDEELLRTWKEDPQALGSIALGLVDQGRMLNAVPFPAGPHWTVVDPANTYATQETVDYLVAALTRVGERFPGEVMRVNHISRRDGGWLRPHKSHQAGRDVDLGFYLLPDGAPSHGKGKGGRMDLKLNWALVRALIEETDVQMIILDRRLQKTLYEYALVEEGEDKAWLDGLFRAGKASLFQHAPRHRDHFHVRFFNPKAQELGRRLQPHLGEKPDEGMAFHRIRRGDTLGAIARKYRSSVAAIRRANPGESLGRLVPGRALMVPARGPCTRCPVAPEVLVPPRRLPPPKAPVAMVRTSGLPHC